jgi:arylsulfatase A-like enzyme
VSGQHTTNHGVVVNSAALFKPAMSLATQLHGVGYYTFLVGKYMNGYDARGCKTTNCAPHVPPGWDRWAALGGVYYYDYKLWVDGTPLHYGSAPADYSTDVIAKRTIDLINTAPANKPIFAWLAPVASHAPQTPAPRYATAPCRPAPWQPPSYQEADVSDKPSWLQKVPRGGAANSSQGACRSLLAVDDLVRDVRDALAAHGRLDNTLFIYTGDNGMNMGEHRLSGKTAAYETQLPFLASWPASLGTSPRQITERLENIDLAPTLCELAGCTLGPYPNGQAHPDGYSFAKLLLGTADSLDRPAVFEDMPKDKGVTTGSGAWFSVITTRHSPLATVRCAAASSGGCLWQYTQYPKTHADELYDLSNGPCWTWLPGQPGDPCELQNVSSNPTYAEIKASLTSQLTALKGERGHP